jgi:NAD(P)-dependent dehydrogenase (short-subunit alcohol dehydrogenase family)
MRLAGKVAIITGGASGMGLATVMRFAAEGAKVVVADLNAVAGNAAVKAATQKGFDVSFIQTDVAIEQDVEAMCQHTLTTFGRLDILFNNAGVGGAIGPLTETTVEDWDYTFDILAKGVFLGIKHGARIMRSQGKGGSIINTASIGGLSGDAGPLVYSAAKAAVINLSKSSAVELAPDYIRVNAICPGFIVTPLNDGGNPEATQRAYSKSQPWPDYGQGDHVAGAALFLASEDALFVTGEAITVDGGAMAEGPTRSRKFPKRSARNSRYSGVSKGSTGVSDELRKLDLTP